MAIHWDRKGLRNVGGTSGVEQLYPQNSSYRGEARGLKPTALSEPQASACGQIRHLSRGRDTGCPAPPAQIRT